MKGRGEAHRIGVAHAGGAVGLHTARSTRWRVHASAAGSSPVKRAIRTATATATS